MVHVSIDSVAVVLPYCTLMYFEYASLRTTAAQDDEFLRLICIWLIHFLLGNSVVGDKRSLQNVVIFYVFYVVFI
jgi:hypothetical protein